jgi:hypothetical protein
LLDVVDHRTRRWSRIGSLCQLLREPQGPPAHGLNFLCSRMCATDTRPAHPRSFLQDRRAWSYLRCAVPVLLSHHWLLTCSCVACCLALALTCGIESSRPLAKRFRSHSRTCRFNSARTSGSCNSAALSICCDAIRTGLPPPPVMCCASNPRRVALTPTASCRCVVSPSELPPLVHLTGERARVLPFNPSAFVGRAPFVAVPQTGDRLLPVPALVSAGLKIGFPSLNNSRQRHSCASPSRVHLRACGRPLLASARSAPASPRATACRSSAPPAHALLHPRAWATPRPPARSGLLASAQVPHLQRSRAGLLTRAPWSRQLAPAPASASILTLPRVLAAAPPEPRPAPARSRNCRSRAPAPRVTARSCTASLRLPRASRAAARPLDSLPPARLSCSAREPQPPAAPALARLRACHARSPLPSRAAPLPPEPRHLLPPVGKEKRKGARIRESREEGQMEFPKGLCAI